MRFLMKNKLEKFKLKYGAEVIETIKNGVNTDENVVSLFEKIEHNYLNGDYFKSCNKEDMTFEHHLMYISSRIFEYKILTKKDIEELRPDKLYTIEEKYKRILELQKEIGEERVDMQMQECIDIRK